jgi:hypothetical protein
MTGSGIVISCLAAAGLTTLAGVSLIDHLGNKAPPTFIQVASASSLIGASLRRFSVDLPRIELRGLRAAPAKSGER